MMAVLQILVTAALSISLTAGACPSGWVSGTYQSCYKFVTTPMKTWTEAEGACRDMGETLAALDSERKNAFIIGYMVMHGLDNITPGNSAWLIGGRWKGNSWQWTSCDGFTHAMTYNRWLPQEPNSPGKKECLEMIAADLQNSDWYTKNFKWNDVVCSVKRKYICERSEVVIGSLG